MNPGPDAIDNVRNTLENVGLSGNALTDDDGSGVDSDPDGDMLAVTSINGVSSDLGMPVSGTTGGLFTLESDGSYAFDPGTDFDFLAAGDVVTTSVQYTIIDTEGATDTATISVVVTGTNDAPTPVGTIPPQIGIDSTTTATLDISVYFCLLYTSPSPRDQRGSRMPSSA